MHNLNLKGRILLLSVALGADLKTMKEYMMIKLKIGINLSEGHKHMCGFTLSTTT